MTKVINLSLLFLFAFSIAWLISLQLKMQECDRLKEKIILQQMKLKKDLEECEHKASTYELKEAVKYLKNIVESV